MKIEDIKREEFNWTDTPVVGMALILTGGSIDSFKNPIDPNVYYEVGKHKVDGTVAILPTERNQKHEFLNEKLKKQNRFN